MSRRSSNTTKVFVGSLPPNVTAEDLQQLFAPYGAIAECDIANRCGFLHLEDKELAMKAITDLNNSTFMGGKISVEKGRVKPRGDRRMRPPRGGGPVGMGRKPRDMGPYSRDSSNYARGNGNFGPRDFNSYDEFRGDYPPPRDFDNGYNRRPMYEERRGGGYMNERRPYNNGYERRQYSDDRSQYAPPARSGGYDRNGPSSYDDRRAPANDRRPLMPEQNMGQAQRPPMSYDRAPPSNEMYSRRDSAPKPLSSFSTSSYERPAQGGYGGYASPDQAASYSAPTGNYGAPVSSSYEPPSAGYGDNRGQTAGYMDNRQPPAQIQSGGFGGSQGTYSSVPSGGYGDNYGVRAPTNTYDTAYPPLPQQRGFAGGNAPGPHRDMPPSRRY